MIKKIIGKVKQWRLVGYIILAKPLIDIHGMEQGVIELFLIVMLGEISARTNKKQITNKEFRDSIK
jgi:hypothetical protein